MARNCNCGGSTCGCSIQASGFGIEVTGSGTSADPFLIKNTGASLETALQVGSTETIKLTLVGDGTDTDPLILTAETVFPLPFRPSTTATRGSPAGLPVGASLFDTTLGIPIWTNGTAWVNASGVAV